MESSAGVTKKLQHAKAVILHGSVAQIPREGTLTTGQTVAATAISFPSRPCSPDSPFSPMPGGTQKNFIH